MTCTCVPVPVYARPPFLVVVLGLHLTRRISPSPCSGWIAPTSLVGFDEGMRKNFHATAKLAKNAKFIAGVEEASRVMDEVHGSSHGLVCTYVGG